MLTDRSEIIPEPGRDRKVPARWCKTEHVTAVDPVPAAARRRGRPGYDRDEVLATAVALFNEQGYDATSVSDLAVRLGLFDAASGRVQVDGDLAEGDRVVVPSL